MSTSIKKSNLELI